MKRALLILLNAVLPVPTPNSAVIAELPEEGSCLPEEGSCDVDIEPRTSRSGALL